MNRQISVVSLTQMHKMPWSLQSFYFANSTFHCSTKYLQTISMNPEASAGNKLSRWISPDITQQRCGLECQTVFQYVFLSAQATRASALAGTEREWLSKRETFRSPKTRITSWWLNIFNFDWKMLHRWDLAFDCVDSWWIVT